MIEWEQYRREGVVCHTENVLSPPSITRLLLREERNSRADYPMKGKETRTI